MNGSSALARTVLASVVACGLSFVPLLSAGAGTRPSPLQRCEARKLRVVAQQAARVLECHGRAARAGVTVPPDCRTRLEEGIRKGFDRVERGGDCPSRVDFAAVTTRVERLTDDLSTALSPAPSPSICASRQWKAVGRDAAKWLKVRARYRLRMDARKLVQGRSRSAQKFSRRIVRAEALPDCLTTPTAGDLQKDYIRPFIHEIARQLAGCTTVAAADFSRWAFGTWQAVLDHARLLGYTNITAAEICPALGKPTAIARAELLNAAGESISLIAMPQKSIGYLVKRALPDFVTLFTPGGGLRYRLADGSVIAVGADGLPRGPAPAPARPQRAATSVCQDLMDVYEQCVATYRAQHHVEPPDCGTIEQQMDSLVHGDSVESMTMAKCVANTPCDRPGGEPCVLGSGTRQWVDLACSESTSSGHCEGSFCHPDVTPGTDGTSCSVRAFVDNNGGMEAVCGSPHSRVTQSCNDGFCRPSESRCSAGTVCHAGSGQCQPSTCGDGIVDDLATPPEQCDDIGQSSVCDADCTFSVCGDGTINAAAGEQCEGADLQGATCTSQGFEVGTLVCDPACTLDTAACCTSLDASGFWRGHFSGDRIGVWSATLTHTPGMLSGSGSLTYTDRGQCASDPLSGCQTDADCTNPERGPCQWSFGFSVSGTDICDHLQQTWLFSPGLGVSLSGSVGPSAMAGAWFNPTDVTLGTWSGGR